MRITPYWGASIARFAALVNKNRAVALKPLTDFTFGTPVVYNGINKRNTYMVLNVTKPGFMKTQDVWYNRLNINVLGKLPVGSVVPVYVPTVPFKIHDILDDLNFSLGLSLTASEVENTRYSTTKPTYTLRIKDGASVAWFGTYDFKATTIKTKINLTSVLTKTALDGFKYPLGDQDPRLTTDVVDRTQELINLINNSNIVRPPLDKKEITFSEPTAVVRLVENSPNASVVVKSTVDGHYQGNVQVRYNRIAFEELNGVFDLYVNDALGINMVIKHVNDIAGTDVDVTDIVVPTIPEMNKVGVYEVILTALATSLKYVGTRKLLVAHGLPSNLEKLHILMNHTLPSDGYLT